MSSTTQAQPASLVRPLDTGAMALIVFMCFFWGLNQVAIKFSLPDYPPLIQVAIRSGGGLLMVLVCSWFRGVRLFARDGTLVPGLISGVLFGLEFVFIFPALQFTTASRASLFVYTAPFFVALGAKWFIPNERIGTAQWLGLAMCFAGLAAAIGIPQANVDARVLLGDFMALCGAALWGATTLVVKGSRLSVIAPEKTLIYQLAGALPIFIAMSAFMGERLDHVPGAVASSWLLYQVLVVGLTFPTWFMLIQRFSATRVSAFTVLTPLFGVAAGCVLLREPFTAAFAFAVVLVAAGLVLVNRRG